MVAETGTALADRCWKPRRDSILNPADSRTMQWSLASDLHTAEDVDGLARWALTGDGTEAGGEHAELGIRLLSDLLLHVSKRDRVFTPRDLYRVLGRDGWAGSGFTALLAGTESEGLLKDERTLGYARSIASSILRRAVDVHRPDGLGFSVRAWMRASGSTGATNQGSALFVSMGLSDGRVLTGPVPVWLKIAAAEATKMQSTISPQRTFVFDGVESFDRVDVLQVVTVLQSMPRVQIVVGVDAQDRLQKYEEMKA